LLLFCTFDHLNNVTTGGSVV